MPSHEGSGLYGCLGSALIERVPFPKVKRRARGEGARTGRDWRDAGGWMELGRIQRLSPLFYTGSDGRARAVGASCVIRCEARPGSPAGRRSAGAARPRARGGTPPVGGGAWGRNQIVPGQAKQPPARRPA